MTSDSIYQHLSEMIRIPTVSYFEKSQESEAAFEAFEAYLKATYPLLFAKARFEKIGRRGFLFTLEGVSDEAPSVLMAHYDVVPADASEWAVAPFSGLIKDDCLWGRGALDTKGTLAAILEAVEEALTKGVRFRQTLYLAFSGEEEVEGESSREMARYLKHKGVKAAFVLDEGGAVIPEGLPGVPGEAAMIGIAEKGVVNMKLTLAGSGGHASTPPRHSLLGRMAKAACAIEAHPFKAHLTEPVIGMFYYIGRKRGGLVGFLFRHVRWYQWPVALLATYMGPTFRAMVQSTTAVTMMNGSPSYNVLPDQVTLGVNLRLLQGDTMAMAKDRLEAMVKDPAIKVEIVSGSDPSPVSCYEGPSWDVLTDTIGDIWPRALAAPYTLNGGTDSRFWHELSDYVYKFTPIVETKEDRATIHGINEKIRLSDLDKLVCFYKKLIEKL